MRASRGSARALKKLTMTTTNSSTVGGSQTRRTATSKAIRSKSFEAQPTDKLIPPSSNKSVSCEQLINSFPPLLKSVDENNNNNNADTVSSARDATLTSTKTCNNNLTTTASETGPLMKVVVSPERGPVELLNSIDGATIVYTDASLIKDGTAGIGIFFGKEHPLNTTQKLPGQHQSVGWAEIIAATVALQKLRAWSKYDKGPVILRTDHLMIVEAMQMKEITERSHPKYFVELQTLKKIAQDYPKGVQFEHVYAHNGEEGNEEADALATKATSKNNLPSPRRTRSKPPSKRMSKRTRSAYIKRSAPPEVHGLRRGGGKEKTKKVAREAYCRTPLPSRPKEIEGRPITWAPKKKHQRSSRRRPSRRSSRSQRR